MVTFGCKCGTNGRKEHKQHFGKERFWKQHFGKESFWMTDEVLVDNIKMDLMKTGYVARMGER